MKEAVPAFAIPSSSFSMNMMLGHRHVEEIGRGLVPGRIVEIFGPEEGGKTGISLDFIAKAQKKGLRTCYVDAERALDLDYAGFMGVDLKALDLFVPDPEMHGAKIFDALRKRLRAEAYPQIVVVDSVDALTPPRELEKDLEDASNIMGLKAHMMGVGIRQVQPLIQDKTVLIFINQLRDSMAMWGPKHVTPGGKALKFYASYRMMVTRSQSKDGVLHSQVNDEVRGHRINVEIVKNKVGRRGKTSFWFDYYKGILVRRDIMQTAKRLSVISLTGRTFSFGKLKAQSLGELAKRIFESKEAVQDLKQKCVAASEDVVKKLKEEPEVY